MTPILDWPDLPALQQPVWPDARARRRPGRPQRPATSGFAGEADNLRADLARSPPARLSSRMGGDCAETFQANTADSIRARLKTLLQMAVVLTYGAGLPVVSGAGWRGSTSPRSQPTEIREGVELASYFGDGVNALPFEPASRIPDPQRLLAAYNASSAALNLVRASPRAATPTCARCTPEPGLRARQPRRSALRARGPRHRSGAAVHDRLRADPEEFRRWTSTPGTRRSCSTTSGPWCASTRVPGCPTGLRHFLWVGERTRSPGGAHIDLAARIRNPIGVKLGPTTTPMMPWRSPTAWTRTASPAGYLHHPHGAGRIREVLPPIIEKVGSGRQPVWLCDPMHGNTWRSRPGTRPAFDDVANEVEGFFEVHRDLDSHPGGIHIELTGDDVTECIGGTEGIQESQLPDRYETACDPRLNREQSLSSASLRLRCSANDDPAEQSAGRRCASPSSIPPSARCRSSRPPVSAGDLPWATTGRWWQAASARWRRRWPGAPALRRRGSEPGELADVRPRSQRSPTATVRRSTRFGGTGGRRLHPGGLAGHAWIAAGSVATYADLVAAAGSGLRRPGLPGRRAPPMRPHPFVPLSPRCAAGRRGQLWIWVAVKEQLPSWRVVRWWTGWSSAHHRSPGDPRRRVNATVAVDLRSDIVDAASPGRCSRR